MPASIFLVFTSTRFFSST